MERKDDNGLEEVERKKGRLQLDSSADRLRRADATEGRGDKPRCESSLRGFQPCDFSKLQLPRPLNESQCFACFWGIMSRVKGRQSLCRVKA